MNGQISFFKIKRREHRKMEMTGKLNKIGITNYEFINTVDGNDLQQIDHYINNV